MRLLLLIVLATSLHAQEFMTTVVKKKATAATSASVTFSSVDSVFYTGVRTSFIDSITTTIPSSSNHYSILASIIYLGSGQRIDSVRAGTVKLVSLGAWQYSTTTRKVFFYGKAGLSSGSTKFYVYGSARTYGHTIFVSHFYNVSQSAPTGSPVASGNDITSPYTFTISCPANGMVVSSFYAGAAGYYGATAPNTVAASESNTTDGVYSAFLYSSSSNPVTTWSGTTWRGGLAIPLNPQ